MKSDEQHYELGICRVGSIPSWEAESHACVLHLQCAAIGGADEA
jgi:hypothetical protein